MSLNLSVNSLPGICLLSFLLLCFGQEFILHIPSCCKQGLRITIEASILQDSRASSYYIGNTNMITVTKRGLGPNKEKTESWHWWNWRHWDGKEEGDSRKEVWGRQLFSSIRFDVRGVKPHWFALFRVAGLFVGCYNSTKVLWPPRNSLQANICHCNPIKWNITHSTTII